MKFSAEFKKEMKHVKSSFIYIVLAFLAAPLVIGVMFGAMYSKMMESEIKFKDTPVYITYKSGSVYENSVEEYLKSSGLSFIKFGNIEDMDERKRSLHIEEMGGSLKIHSYGKTSIEKNIISTMVSEYMNLLYKKGDGLSAEEIETFTQEYMRASYGQQMKTTVIETEKRLSSYQLMIMNLFIAMSLFLSVKFASEFIRSRENSVLKRLISMDTDDKGIFINSVLSVFIICWGIALIYFTVVGKIILKMELGIMGIVIPTLLQALIITALYSISIAVFKREHTFKNAISGILMGMMILGGSTFPIEMFGDVIFIAKMMPNYNMQKVFTQLAIGSGIDQIALPAGIIVAECSVLIILGMLLFRAAERRKGNVEYSSSKLEKNIEGL